MKISIKSRIMFRVYLAYIWRKARSPFVAESTALGVLAFTLSLFVSLAHIFSNMKGSGNLYQYFIVAFSHTSIGVQAVVVLSAVATIFLVKNLTVHTVFKQRFA